jgi:hypothetical protein
MELTNQPISSLIAVDDTARFRNDVQLSLYDDPEENLALLQSYIFTVAAPGSTGAAAARVASVSLLEQLVNSFLHTNPGHSNDNRIFALANFGHGKSHLALALTNYFAKPVDSKEVEIVLEKLEHAINEPARAAKFRTFKENRGEFLVIRLRGDIPSTLSEQFFAGLDRALKEHDATKDIVAPVWHKNAEAILTNLTDAEIVRANVTLAEFGHDVPTLIAAVQAHKDVRDYCVKALTAAKGMVPDLSAQSSLKDTIGWAVKNLCGEGKPLGGVLVLFDEFSFFVNRYGRQGVSGELQDLLNGISDHPRHALFLAFGQFDPDTVASNAPLSTHARDSLKQELTRIPKKLALYSLMESVIDAYLRQREYAWGAFSKLPDVKDALDWASIVAFNAFAPRYNADLRWHDEEFYKVITKGCFPLHPLTSVLLCNLRFSGGDGMSDPRTVLGFVLQQLDAKLPQPLMLDTGIINWVMPIELVDYFEQRISPEIYAQYVNARRNLTHDANELQRQILKALYLYQAAELSLAPRDQIDFIVEAIGIPGGGTEKSRQSISNALSALAAKSVIQHNLVSKTYSFWPSTVNFAGGEELVKQKMSKSGFTLEMLHALNTKLQEYGYRDLTVDVSWGHPDDWAATQQIMTRSNFKPSEIEQLARPYGVNNWGKIDEGVRGMVIWLAAKDEDDLAWFRSHAAEILDQALPKDAPPPILAMLPSEPTPGLFLACQRLIVLTGLTTNERAKIGTEAFDHMLRQASQAVRDELERLIGDRNQYIATTRASSSIVAPLALRPSLSTLPSYSLQKVLESAYRTAYRHAPKQFFKQYRAATSGNNNLRNAVKQVADILLAATPEALSVALNSNPVARELRDKYLTQAWGLLSSTCAIKPPTDLSIKHGWNYLEQAFPAGGPEERVGKHLMVLLNAPYGYDYNTVTLLFAAWFANNHHDIILYAQGKKVGVNLLQEQLAKGPKDFLQAICGVHAVALARVNPDVKRKRIKTLIDTNSFQLADVNLALEELEAFANDERTLAQERDAARLKHSQLSAAVDVANTYTQRAREIDMLAKHGSDVVELVDKLNGLADMPTPTLVVADAPPLYVLRTALVARLTEVVHAQCKRWEQPNEPTQIELHRTQLKELRAAVDNAKLVDLSTRVKAALSTLEAQVDALTRRQQEEKYLQRIRAVSLSSNFTTLCESKNELDAYEIHTEEIKRELDRKVAQLTRTIQELEQFATTLPERCAAVNGRHLVDKLRDEIMKQQARFIGSDYEQLMVERLAQMDKLRAFFDDLDDFKRQLPQSQADVERVTLRFEALVNQYQNELSEVQRGLLEEVRQLIQTHVSESQERARRWFKQQLEQAHNGANPTQLAQQLSKVPSFFPAELVAELKKLRGEVQARIDSDMILRVEQAFRAIHGRAKQEECLQRLALIMQNAAVERVHAE